MYLKNRLQKIFLSFLISIFIVGLAIYSNVYATPNNDALSKEMLCIFKNSSYLVKISPANRLRSPKEASMGAGFIFVDGNNRGILTNNHVLGPRKSRYAWVFFKDIKFAKKVRILGRDPFVDLALLELPSSIARNKRIKSIRFAKDGVLAVGINIYGVGFPFNIESIADGRVTAMASSASPWFFSSSVPLLPGNSGGPMVSYKSCKTHEVVGVNTAISTIGVLSWSINIKYVKRLLPRLKRERIVKHAELGGRMFDAWNIPPSLYEFITDEDYPPRNNDGVMTIPVDNGPLNKAGMEKGDTILSLSFKGVPYPFSSARELNELIFFEFKPGQVVKLLTRRGEQEFKRTVTLGKRPLPNSSRR